MSKKKLLFIAIIEVFVFIVGLGLFLLLFSNNETEDISEDMIGMLFTVFLIASFFIYKITSNLYKNISYHEVSNISLKND